MIPQAVKTAPSNIPPIIIPGPAPPPEPLSLQQMLTFMKRSES